MRKKTYSTVALWLIISPIMAAMVGFLFYGFFGVVLRLPGFDDDISLDVRITLAVAVAIFIVFLCWMWIDAILRQKIVLDEYEVWAPQNTFLYRNHIN